MKNFKPVTFISSSESFYLYFGLISDVWIDKAIETEKYIHRRGVVCSPYISYMPRSRPPRIQQYLPGSHMFRPPTMQ